MLKAVDALTLGFILTKEESAMLLEVCDLFERSPHDVIIESIRALHMRYIGNEDEMTYSESEDEDERS